MADDASRTLKICLLGDGSAGKTSIVHRYCQEHFGQSYLQTVGLDFYLKRLVLPGDVHVTLKIWDIGGQSLGGKMIRTYIDSCDAICYVYDITNRDSFENLDDWHSLVKKHFAGKSKTPHLALLANKIDLGHLRAIQSAQHNSFAAAHNCRDYFVSAKTGHSVAQAFRSIVAVCTGIPVSAAEETVDGPVITAEIVQHPTIAPRVQPKLVQKKSSVCSLQ